MYVCMYVSVMLRNVAVTSRRNVASMIRIRRASYLVNHLLVLAERVLNCKHFHKKDESTNLISQPPERMEYTYELKQLQLTNTCSRV